MTISNELGSYSDEEPPDPLLVATAIEAGVEYMDANGWHQGDWYPGHSTVLPSAVRLPFQVGKPTCGLGSLQFGQQEVTDFVAIGEAISALHLAVNNSSTEGAIGFGTFNDSAEDYSVVRDLMLETAKDIRNNIKE